MIMHIAESTNDTASIVLGVLLPITFILGGCITLYYCYKKQKYCFSTRISENMVYDNNVTPQSQLRTISNDNRNYGSLYISFCSFLFLFCQFLFDFCKHKTEGIHCKSFRFAILSLPFFNLGPDSRAVQGGSLRVMQFASSPTFEPVRHL